MTQSLKLLAAAALHPGLRSVLLFDATPEQVDSTARALARLLDVVEGDETSEVHLVWHDDEDSLWGYGLDLPWRRPGLLAQEDGQDGWRLVVARDLTRLNLSAQRACVQTAGADCVSLERCGESRTWRPRLAWLASCPRDAVGQVSPHLLDRFALRWTAPPLGPSGRTAALRSWLDEVRIETRTPSPVPEEWTQRLLRARDAPPPSFGEQPTLDRLTRSLAGRALPGTRPHLAVARLAVALAWLEDELEVSPHRVDEAITLLGLEPAGSREVPAKVPETTDKKTPNTESPAIGAKKGNLDEKTVGMDGLSGGEVAKGTGGEPVGVSEPSREPEIVGALDPWPENQAPVEREFATLQPPLSPTGRRTVVEGIPVGVRPTSEPREMALLPTLFAAAPFQKIRKCLANPPRAEGDPRWILEEMDLRAWRRTPAAHEMLVLVLDATSFGPAEPSSEPDAPPRWRCDWPSSLVPHIRWAYVRRASVGLVLVGTAEAENELRAERIVARSVLVPSFQRALDCNPGRATPLADGLQLALETVRHALQHGRGRARRARLVVLSDGRGNIPLAVSCGEPLESPVGRQGVEDSLEVARELAGLRGVDVVVLDPQPGYARHLTTELAEALEAGVEEVPLTCSWEISA